MSIIGDLQALAPKREAVGASLLRLGFGNISQEQLGSLVCLALGGLLAPDELSASLRKLSEMQKEPEQKVVQEQSSKHGKERRGTKKV